MLQRRQVTVSFLNPAYVLPVVLLTLLFSCTVPRKFQSDKSFVFDVDVKVEANMKPADKQDLSSRLANQLDDSLRTQIVSFAGIYKKIVYPPVYDSANVRRSIGFMVALLNSSGYYSPAIKDSIRRVTKKGHYYLKISWPTWHPRFQRIKAVDQYRVYVDFKVLPGKQLKLDSIGYDLSTPELQALALKSRPQSLLKKNTPYSKQVLSAELDRLVDTFRNNGYYMFSKEDLVIVRDTVVAALIDPTLDPFRQAALLEELKKKRDNPTINVVVQQRPVKDSARIARYTIGHVTIYPDLPVLEDTVTTTRVDTSTAKKFTIISRSDKFKNIFLTKNVYLRPDRLYKQFNYTRTLNKFNQMGAWQQSFISLVPSDSADSVLDVVLRLYPAKKQNLNIALEVSRNSNYIVTASNLLGTSLSLGLRNRNTFRQSVLSSTNLRGGVELGGSFIQTTQASLSHTISFPKLIAPFAVKREYRLDSLRTVLDFNASYTDRRRFFTLRSFNTSFGYQWTKNNHTFVYRPLNIEFTNLDKTDSLQKLLDSIPSLKLAFKSGLVIGQQFIFSSYKKTGLHTDFFRFSAEESGAILGFIKTLDEGQLWRYVKGDIEIRRHIDYNRTQLALRAYAGAGWAYGREGTGYEQTLPFYKAFFAGGPNSMRGWQVRQLGLGSSTFYDTAGGGLVDRFGDVQLEANIEYRFPLGTVFGIKLLSALYADAGNIWNRHVTDTAKAAQGSDFKFDRFYKEIAVDAGTGLRLDFNYFLIRFDWAYKIRDPQALVNANRWFYGLHLGSGQFQLGLGYPF
jgi:outer membrane protein insertion porin family